MYELYAAIWRVSARRQVILILLSAAIAALAAVPLSYQKDIINALTSKQISNADLMMLCAEMMGLILLSLGLKWAQGLGANLLGEDVIRRIRQRIYHVGLDPDDDQDVATGTLTTMVSAEAEELGKFAGSAFSEPVMQIGTMISVVGYIAAEQPLLGLIALGIVTPQVVVVLATQRVVNARVAERVRILRKATSDIVTDDLKQANDAVEHAFDEIYDTRRSMFLWKLSTKFVLSAINGAGTVGLLALGGWYVLEGRTDVGTVVAATMGLSRLQGPTSFLIAFYRQISATRVKFDLLRDVTLSRRHRRRQSKTAPTS